MKKTILFLLFYKLITYTTAFAQGNSSIEVSPFYGITIFSVDRFKMQGNFYGGEMVYHLSMAHNQADWVRMLNIKDISFVVSYRHLDDVSLTARPGSEGVLGHTVGIGGRLSINIANLGKTQLMFYPGFGTCYATETFQTTGNPLIGSKLNFSISTGLKLVTLVGNKTRLMYGVDIYHYSNGALALPNEGANTFNASIGIDQNIGTQGPETSKHLFTDYNKSTFEIGINVGRRGLVQSGSGLTGQAAIDQKNATSKLFDSGFYLGYNYRVSPVFSLKAGTDAVYSYTKFDYNNFYGTFQERSTGFDQLRYGAGLGVDIWLGRVAAEASYGHYIHFDNYYPEHWYWTMGAKMYITDWMAIEGKLYLHGTEANFTGYGLLFKVK